MMVVPYRPGQRLFWLIGSILLISLGTLCGFGFGYYQIHRVEESFKNGFLELDESQTHYIRNVMRLKIGENFNIFNEHDGEWSVELSEFNKKISKVKILEEIGIKDEPSDVWMLFAPVKKLRVDFIAQKVTELGAKLIWPVITERTQYKNIKKSKNNCKTNEKRRLHTQR